MGADFLDKATPTFKKSFDRARIKLATADLFTREPTANARTCAADIIGDASFAVGDHVVLEKSANRLIGRRGTREVLTISSPPSELVNAIENSSGVAKGIVKSVHQLAGVVELSTC